MDALKQRIDEMYAFVNAATYYEALGVKPDSSSTEITKAFRGLAKDWHVDRFSSVDLGEHAQTLQKIFAILNKAHVALSKQETRDEYDLELNGGNQDASAEIGIILQASAEFRQGKNMMQRGSYRGAMDKFVSASEKQPDEKEYQAYLCYCEFLLSQKDDDGIVVDKTRASEIYRQLDTISETLKERDWLVLFMGNVAAGMGRASNAKSLYTEALQINPKNHEAKRELRLIRMRKDTKSKGFFSNLFAKK